MSKYEGLKPYYCYYCGKPLEETEFNLEGKMLPKARKFIGLPMRKFVCKSCKYRFVFVLASPMEIYVSEIDEGFP